MYVQLTATTPPAVEPVPIETVRRHCRVDSDYDDDLLAMYEVSARDWVERWLNRALITTKYTYTMTPAPPPYPPFPLVPFQPWVVLPFYHYPYSWQRPVSLPRAPCKTLDLVRAGNIGELVDLPADQYTANLAAEPATVSMRGTTALSIPGQAIEFQFTAGYGDDPADVPPPIKAAILLLTAWLYEGRGDVNSAGPDAAWALLAGFRLWQFSG